MNDSKNFEKTELFIESVEKKYIENHTTRNIYYEEEYVNKLEEKITRLNNIIDETIEDISFCLTSIVQEKNSSRDSRTRQEMLTCEQILIKRLNKLKELKEEGK